MSQNLIKRVYNLPTEFISHLNEQPISKVKFTLSTALPPVVDLRSKFGPVYDQGSLGSCTANAVVGAIQYDDPDFFGSRLFVYWNARNLDNTVNDDSGTSISQGINVAGTFGMCKEVTWSYNINNFKVKPTDNCFTEAIKYKAIDYCHVDQTSESMRGCLASGYPIVLGITIYESFESIKSSLTGNIPMPQANEKILGGHAIICVGYDDTKKIWIMRNSWGSLWGDSGYFYLPYDYLLNNNLCSDLWKITKTSDPDPEPTPTNCSCLSVLSNIFKKK